VEDRIRWGKTLRLETHAFSKFSSGSVWLMGVMLAQDLLAWALQLCLEGPSGAFGEIWRRERLYSSHLVDWHRWRAAGGPAGLNSQRGRA
jgi:cbb3-type cytochrome oxidase subunit 1